MGEVEHLSIPTPVYCPEIVLVVEIITGAEGHAWVPAAPSSWN